MRGAASLALRTRVEDERVAEWLREIALRAREPAGHKWALARLAARWGGEGWAPQLRSTRPVLLV